MQTNKSGLQEFLSLPKTRDPETASWKNRGCETYIPAKRKKLRNPCNGSIILRDIRTIPPPFIVVYGSLMISIKRQKPCLLVLTLDENFKI